MHCVLVCFLVKFDLLFAFSVLSCRILDCTSLFIYVHEHDHLCFPMLTVETAVFDCICWLSSSCDKKGQSSLIRSNTVWNRQNLELGTWKSTLRAWSIRVNLNHGTEILILFNLLIRPGEILKSVTWSLFMMKACDCKWLPLIFELPA